MFIQPHRTLDSKPLLSELERLEQRLMLSTVEVTFSGQTGDELLRLVVDGEATQVYEVSTSPTTISYESESLVSADQVRIEFINDVYDPGAGYDRNLIVDRISVDGVVFETEDPSTFGTGTWTGSAITPGFNQTETLHANGFFQFAEPIQALNFAGYEWQRNNATSNSEAIVKDGLLTVRSSTDADSAIWTSFDVGANEFYEFKIDAFRNELAGSLQFDGQPWTTAGIDLFDASGSLVDKVEIQVFGPTELGADSIRTKQFVTPGNAVSASIWVWAQRTQAGVDIPMRISELSLTEIEVTDQTPPNVVLVRSPITQPTNTIQFTLEITDDSELVVVNDGLPKLTISGPNGFSQTLDSIAGVGMPGGVSEFFALAGSFTSASNGEYFVSVNEGQVGDEFGNFVSAGLIGSFLVNIQA